MKIGIDIDDTIVYTAKSMLKYADLYDKNILGRTGKNNNFGKIRNRYYLEALYNWDNKTKYNFFDTYYKNVLEECELMENANTIINSLKKAGHEILFITARLNNIEGCNVEEITKNTLKKYNILYDKLIVGAKYKLEVCKENKIEIFIEDSYETCVELEEIGIKTFLMTTKMNKELDSGKIERVKDWKDLDRKINKYI